MEERQKAGKKAKAKTRTSAVEALKGLFKAFRYWLLTICYLHPAYPIRTRRKQIILLILLGPPTCPAEVLTKAEVSKAKAAKSCLIIK